MNILGVDYGKYNIGLAWMQEGVDVILPFGRIEVADVAEKLPRLAALIQEEKIDTVVMGIPLGLDGEENPNTKRIREFAAALKKRVNIPVILVDERFTTAEAQEMGGEASLDEKAAMLILEEYKATN